VQDEDVAKACSAREKALGIANGWLFRYCSLGILAVIASAQIASTQQQEGRKAFIMNPKIALTQEMIEAQVEQGRQAIAKRRALGPDPNSALVWFPPIERAGLPVPRTEFVEYDPYSLFPLLDGQPIGDFPMGKLEEACGRVGYPCFLRTDLASAKHEGLGSFKVTGPDDLPRAVFSTFESNCLKDLAPFTRAFMVREWIGIPAAFTAFGGLAIGVEWRFFAGQDGVRCHHFYWPAEAFRYSFERGGGPADWQERLDHLRTEPSPATLGRLEEMALDAVRAVGAHEWSIDFALDDAGRYWLIDMARAETSWHPDHNS